jgi:hypothetical protein
VRGAELEKREEIELAGFLLAQAVRAAISLLSDSESGTAALTARDVLALARDRWDGVWERPETRS